MKNQISKRIVFVEIGRFPKHLRLNILRIKNLFPDVEIHFLTDQINHRRCDSLPAQIHRIEEFAPLPDISNLSRYTNTGDLFWLHTIQRIFAFTRFHQKLPPGPLLHVESDVTLLKDFPWEKFFLRKKLMWGKYNLSHDVASLLFSPHGSASLKLEKSILKELSQNLDHSDMTVLSSVARLLGEDFEYLPSFQNSNSKLINARSQIPTKLLREQFQLYDYFGGIFDHQIIGMYLDGLNPANKYGIRENLFTSTIETGESWIDPSSVTFTSNDEALQIQDDLAIPVFSIHVHSKKLGFFKGDITKTLFLASENASQKTKVVVFDLRVFVGLLWSNLRSRTFLQWTRHLAVFLKRRIFL